jgi:uncharacterized membrane protein (GlpM family)
MSVKLDGTFANDCFQSNVGHCRRLMVLSSASLFGMVNIGDYFLILVKLYAFGA